MSEHSEEQRVEEEVKEEQIEPERIEEAERIEQPEEQQTKEEEKKAQPQPQEQPEQKSQLKDIKVQQLVNQKKDKQQPSKMMQQLPVERKSVTPPVIVNPVVHYKGHEKYNWRLEEFQATEFIQKLEVKILPDVHQLPIPQDMDFTITGTNNLKGHVYYTLRVKDKKGEREVARRYTEYVVWRNKLTSLWPCIFMTTLPNKTLMGTSEEDIINNRHKYIIRFLRSLCQHQIVYHSQEVQFFLNEGEQTSMQQHFESLPAPKYLQILQKYKKVFSDDYIYSQREEFVYRKQKVPQLLAQYQLYFGNKKMDLMDSLTAIRRLSQSKQNYFRAVNKLSQTFLPEYQDCIYRWIYGQSLPEQPPSIMERMSRRATKSVQEGEQPKAQQAPQEVVAAKFGLYSSQAYKSKLQDTTLLMHDYNSSTTQIYDVVKYQLKEIDTVLHAIEQTKHLSRQMQYLSRTITINKQQIESLNSNKKTLKTFFMEGNNDEKKTKLTNDNNIIEQQLQKYTQLYYLIMVLLQKQLQQFHKTRAQFYTNSMQKAFTDQLLLTKSIMDFKVFEEQLFAKDRVQRIKLLKGQPEEEEGDEEIRQ